MPLNLKFASSVFFICSTTIGGGILALPLGTYEAGFTNSTFAMLVIFVMMLISALGFCEVNLNEEGNVNFLSLTQKYFGKLGLGVCLFSYISLLYALICAYLTATSAWVLKIDQIYSINLIKNSHHALILTCLLFSVFLSSGVNRVSKFNSTLTVLMFATFCILLGLNLPTVDSSNLVAKSGNPLHNLTLLVTSFGFAIIIPTLKEFLGSDKKYLGKCVVIGSIIPLVFYILWQIIVLGNIPPVGDISMESLALNNANGTEVALTLAHIRNNAFILSLCESFAIFAVLTSLIGVSLSLLDFIKDGISLDNNDFKANLLLQILVFFPPYLLVKHVPNAFGMILNYSGFLVIILLGLIPCAMVVKTRFNETTQGKIPTVVYFINFCLFTLVFVLNLLYAAN